MRNYKKIGAWQKADDLAVDVYRLSGAYPAREVYGVTQQVRRAATSVAANIAEGAGRETKKDYLHFLYIARGSLNETDYFLHLSLRLGFIDEAQHGRIDEQVRRTFAALHGLIAAVEKETSKLGKAIARTTSRVALLLSGFVA